jgi:hypothetical protein
MLEGVEANPGLDSLLLKNKQIEIRENEYYAKYRY